MPSIDNHDEIDREIEILNRILCESYGYDFRQYARASQKRRLHYFMQRKKINAVSDIIRTVPHDKALLFELLNDLTVSTTELFRDPGFYQALQIHVIPMLNSYPTFKVWHAGCSTGEEAYSLAILLHEHGLLKRGLIYATDINKYALERARKGIVDSNVVKRDSANYYKAGMQHSLHEYWRTHHGHSLLDSEILQAIVFSEHNLVTDHIFGEMQLVLCRNVLIYFNRSLQNQVLMLLRDSLCRHGFLGLGSKETLAFSQVTQDFKVVNREQRLYQKKSRI